MRNSFYALQWELFSGLYVLLGAVLVVSSVSCGSSGPEIIASETVRLSPASAQPPCPNVSIRAVKGVLPHDSMTEVSGMVASRGQRGVIFVHNDSGDAPRVYAISLSGLHLATYRIEGIEAYDWEDMSSDGDFLYVADIGDNMRTRRTVVVHRFKEPLVSLEGRTQFSGEQLVTEHETAVFSYPDGPHDAEAFMVDPTTKDVVIVTKERKGGSVVFSGPFTSSGGVVNLRRLVTLPAPRGLLFWARVPTAVDISPSGNAVILRTYVDVSLWTVRPGQPLMDVFAQEPCVLEVESEPQGEAISFDHNGSGFFTVSEGASQPIRSYGL